MLSRRRWPTATAGACCGMSALVALALTLCAQVPQLQQRTESSVPIPIWTPNTEATLLQPSPSLPSPRSPSPSPPPPPPASSPTPPPSSPHAPLPPPPSPPPPVPPLPVPPPLMPPPPVPPYSPSPWPSWPPVVPPRELGTQVNTTYLLVLAALLVACASCPAHAALRFFTCRTPPCVRRCAPLDAGCPNAAHHLEASVSRLANLVQSSASVVQRCIDRACPPAVSRGCAWIRQRLPPWIRACLPCARDDDADGEHDHATLLKVRNHAEPSSPTAKAAASTARASPQWQLSRPLTSIRPLNWLITGLLDNLIEAPSPPAHAQQGAHGVPRGSEQQQQQLSGHGRSRQERSLTSAHGGRPARVRVEVCDGERLLGTAEMAMPDDRETMVTESTAGVWSTATSSPSHTPPTAYPSSPTRVPVPPIPLPPFSPGAGSSTDAHACAPLGAAYCSDPLPSMLTASSEASSPRAGGYLSTDDYSADHGLSAAASSSAWPIGAESSTDFDEHGSGLSDHNGSGSAPRDVVQGGAHGDLHLRAASQAAIEALASPTRALTAYADAVANIDADYACETFVVDSAASAAREALHMEAREGSARSRIISISVSSWDDGCDNGRPSEQEWAQMHALLSPSPAAPPPATPPSPGRTCEGPVGGSVSVNEDIDEDVQHTGVGVGHSAAGAGPPASGPPSSGRPASARWAVPRLGSAERLQPRSQSARRPKGPTLLERQQHDANAWLNRPKPAPVSGAPSCMDGWHRRQRQRQAEEHHVVAAPPTAKTLPPPKPLPPYAGAVPRAIPHTTSARAYSARPTPGKTPPPLLDSERAKLGEKRPPPLVCFTNTRFSSCAPKPSQLEPHQTLPQRIQFFIRTQTTKRTTFGVKGFSDPLYTEAQYLLTATVQPGYESAGPTFILDDKVVRKHVIGCTTWPSPEPYLNGELHLEIVVPSTDRVNPGLFGTALITCASNQSHRGDAKVEKPAPLQHTMGSNIGTGNELPRINVPVTPKPIRPPAKVRAVFYELAYQRADGHHVLDYAKLELALRALGADMATWQAKAALAIAQGWARLGGDATLDVFEFSQAAAELSTIKPPHLALKQRNTSQGPRHPCHGSPFKQGTRERVQLFETVEKGERKSKTALSPSRRPVPPRLAPELAQDEGAAAEEVKEVAKMEEVEKVAKVENVAMAEEVAKVEEVKDVREVRDVKGVAKADEANQEATSPRRLADSLPRTSPEARRAGYDA